ncbi:MAG: phage major capsid protein [Clostridiales bacterium]|jgi:HK97 family phage major capsid protein|nr:phage major capsid protein [Clostridiales bacterium]
MTFKTIAEAFNHYRTSSIDEIERRAAEIKGTIETDPAADITTLNIELSGLKQAKENAHVNQEQNAQRSNFNPITGMELRHNTSQEAVEGDVFASAEYRSAFFKKLLGQKLTERESSVYSKAMDISEVERRADAFNTVTNSAAVLPTATLNEVIKKARTMGGLLPVCRSFNIPTKISVPVGTPSSKASWHIEGAKVDSDKNEPVSVMFDGFEILKVFSISAAAKKMSIDAFEAYIIEELTNCVMECINDALVNGNGEKQGAGLLTGVTWVDGVNSLTFSKTAGLSYSDCTKTIAALKRGYANGAKWAMNNATLYNLFYGMMDGTQRPIFITDPQSESIGKILGFPVVVDDNIAGETIFFGNFNYMGYNMPDGSVVEVSRDSSFKSGLIDYRAMTVADCKPIVPEAFVKLTRATA